jgi:mono/diheme cytochrome c family protein
MSLPRLSDRTLPSLTIFCCLVLLGALPFSARLSVAQDNRSAVSGQTMSSSGGGDVARGKYIVEDVAMCGTCHTPRNADGSLNRNRWLAGASVPYLPAQPSNDWPILAPRLAGNPPANNAQMVTLLTTAVWITGKPLRDPMPKFHMTKADAEAVVAYLRSLSLNP